MCLILSQALIEVIITSTDGHICVRATILLGELLHLVSICVVGVWVCVCVCVCACLHADMSVCVWLGVGGWVCVNKRELRTCVVVFVI